MKSKLLLSVAALAAAPFVFAGSGPFDGKRFQGRIAYSCDGNQNDEDDWAASPVALALMAEFGVKDRLVHFDYNNILDNTISWRIPTKSVPKPRGGPEWEKQHEISVRGAVERYGFNPAIFFDCRRDLDAAVSNIAKAINESSEDNPLYFILAGPMEVPFLGIQKADPAKRKFVYCISHSSWNDGFGTNYTYAHTKRSVIPSGVKWVQVKEQNLLATSPWGRPATPAEWAPWEWMRDSAQPKVRFLWDRLRATTRADASDSGMTWFLLTGDEEGSPAKLRKVFEDHVLPIPLEPRGSVRLEAENFVTFENFELENRNDRTASHRLEAKLTGAEGRISTTFDEPYTAAGLYDVSVRYSNETAGRTRLRLLINGAAKGQSWEAGAGKARWDSHTVPALRIQPGDTIAVEATAEGTESTARLDYVQLNLKGGAVRFRVTGPLDDPAALPGQIIVAGGKPGYLKYNGGGPAFLAGPDNPEDFFFQASGQEQMIARMARTGVSAFHCLMFRMRRCNIKDEGDDTHNPFVDHDPSKPLDEAVLARWNRWLGLLEEAGVVVDFEFYNDATDVELMGWKLDPAGNLHPDEQRFITGIVNRFQHRRNIIWSIEESCNKPPASRTAHFRKIAEVIARTDRRHHPIVQSFVVPEDPDQDFPAGGALPDAYIGDPNINIVTWLHLVPHGDDLDMQHEDHLRYYRLTARHFIPMKNETFWRPYLNRGPLSRRYMWSAALAGLQTLEAQHYANKPHDAVLREDGLLASFMEQTDYYNMKPRDELAAGSTKWVLANPGQSYIAYTYDCSKPMGIKGLAAGVYDLKWLDTVDGETVTQTVTAPAGDAVWAKPDSLDNEIALYIKRRGVN